MEKSKKINYNRIADDAKSIEKRANEISYLSDYFNMYGAISEEAEKTFVAVLNMKQEVLIQDLKVFRDSLKDLQ